jgi:cell division protease FtsH
MRIFSVIVICFYMLQGIPTTLAADSISTPPSPSIETPYSQALNMASHHDIAKLYVIPSDDGFPLLIVKGNDGIVRRVMAPTSKLDDVFLNSGAQVWGYIPPHPSNVIGRLAGYMSLLVMTLFAISFFVLLKGMRKGTARRSGGMGGIKEKVTFDDVAGQDEAKSELSEIVEFLKNPSKFTKLGARVPKGVLLDGLPGNGKTMLAKAVAGEAHVPFYHLDGPEVLEVFAGLGARRIRKTFAQCRKRTLWGVITHRPIASILFIDEIDAIAGRRGIGSDGASGEREQIVNQLLVEMDGLGKRPGVIVIGATNRSDMLDPALKRAGRMDRHVTVSPPDVSGREAIAKVHARSVILSNDVDFSEIARMTTGFSGADVANLVNEAAITAARHGLHKVDMASFHLARDRKILGLARGGDIMSEGEKEIVSWHEAGHALMALSNPLHDPIHKASILPRGRGLGVVVTLPERDAMLTSKAKLISMVDMILGGRAAEEILSGVEGITGGAESDIEQSTLLVRSMVGRWGMSQKLGMLSYFTRDGQPLAAGTTMAAVDEEAREFIAIRYQKVLSFLLDNKKTLSVLAAELRAKETLSGDDIRLLVKPLWCISNNT